MKLKPLITKSALVSALPILGLAFVACHDRDHDKPAAGEDRSYVSAHLVGEASDEYDAVDLRVAALKLTSGDGKATESVWTAKESEPRPLTRSGPEQRLTERTPLPRRGYRKCVLQLHPSSSVTPKGGGPQPLALPQAFKTGITLDLPEASEGKDYDLLILVDPSRIIQRTRGADGKLSYTLRHGFRLVDRNVAGSIEGRVTDAAGSPGKGLTVTAQSRTSDAATVERSAVTGHDGKYRLDHLLLPGPGGPWHVVGLPGPDAALASRAVQLSLKERNATSIDLQVQKGALMGSVEGTITRAVDALGHDEVEILQDLPAGSGQPAHPFVVRFGLAERNHDGSQSTFTFAGLPAGDYRIRTTRATMDDSGKVTRTIAVPTRELKVEPDKATRVQL